MATAARPTSKPKTSPAKSTETRDVLVMKHLPLVRHVLGKIAHRLPSHVDRRDLLEAGVLGLLDAAERYDLDRNVRFSTYAVTRIRGAILDAMREEDWLPRSLRNEVTSMDEACTALEHEHKRPPTIEELSNRLGVSRKKLAKLTRASRHGAFQSLDAIPEGTLAGAIDPTYSPTAGEHSPAERAMLAEQKELLAGAIGTLPKAERLVITLYYFEQLLLRDIARILRVSDSRICQIHRKGLARLQRRMTEPEPALALAT